MPELIERERELEAIAAATDRARAGAGTLLLISGPAGIGKSSLLSAAVHAADGMHVLRAEGAEVTRAFAFGVVRQLLDRLIANAIAENPDVLEGAAGHARALVADPTAGPSSDSLAITYGVYWFVANLAQVQPLLLCVDDAHWADPASATCLAYLARRVEDLPVLLAVAARPAEPGADPTALAGLDMLEEAVRLEPGPLSEDGVVRLVAAQIGGTSARELAAACRAATGGVPFYVREVLNTLSVDGLSPDAAVLAMSDLTPDSVVRATLARLGRMDQPAHALARAVAVLEPHAPLRFAAALAQLSSEDAVRAADELHRVGVLAMVEPCRFVHPILRSAVYSSIEPAQRSHAHARAARLCERDGRALEIAAMHLQASPPAGEPRSVRTLRGAAAEALGRGDPLAAVQLLQRALDEPPAAADRPAVLLELGTAEALAQEPSAVAHLTEAFEKAETEELRLAAATGLARALWFTGDAPGAYAVAAETLAGEVDASSPAQLGLEFLLIQAGLQAGLPIEERLERIERELEPVSDDARAVTLVAGFARVVAAAPVDQWGALYERARIDEPFDPSAIALATTAAAALLYADELDRALPAIDRDLERARQLGSVRDFAFASAVRGVINQRRGDLDAAEADIEQALSTLGEGEPAVWIFPALAGLALVQLDRDNVEAAAKLVGEVVVPPPLETVSIALLVRDAQAAVMLAEHRPQDAADLLERTGEALTRVGVLAPSAVPWRSSLALALRALGREDEGAEHVRMEAALAERAGLRRAYGIAMRALGLVRGGEEGVAHLSAAVAALESTPARVEHARALLDLGSLLRRTRHRREAREPLATALDLATRSGAHALANRALVELRATGAKPRTKVLGGEEALTPGERRVCELAATGLTNAQIAQTLFVTQKTVEAHLGRAYRKLDLAGRAELPKALGQVMT